MTYKNDSTDRLFNAILKLSTLEECYDFFDDLCTIKEMQDMAQRLDAAILLKNGLSYQKIAEKASISPATISRVNRCLNYGTGGYNTAISKMSKEEKEI